jgi:hypothetical protein
MPIYEFRLKETGEVFEEFFNYQQKIDFLEANPDIEEIIGAPNFVSGIAGVTHKNDSGFNDLLNRIGNANPYAPLGEQHADKGIKSTKTREAVNKARNKK